MAEGYFVMPTLPPAADLRRDGQRDGCMRPEKERWDSGLGKGNVVLETVRGQEYKGEDAV